MEVKTHEADENPRLEGIACGLRSHCVILHQYFND